jgi:hypothetical protein
MDYKKVLQLKEREMRQAQKLKEMKDELTVSAKLYKQWRDYLIATYGTDDSVRLSLRYNNTVSHVVFNDLREYDRVRQKIKELKEAIEVESADIGFIDSMVDCIY